MRAVVDDDPVSGRLVRLDEDDVCVRGRVLCPPHDVCVPTNAAVDATKSATNAKRCFTVFLLWRFAGTPFRLRTCGAMRPYDFGNARCGRSAFPLHSSARRFKKSVTAPGREPTVKAGEMERRPCSSSTTSRSCSTSSAATWSATATRVVTAGDSDGARRLIEREQPSLVLLDVMLPGATDGLASAAGSGPARPAGHHAHRARRDGRQDRRPRARRRRLPHQAVLATRAHRARPERPSPVHAQRRPPGSDRARRI